jgi:hypothetical protein
MYYKEVVRHAPIVVVAIVAAVAVVVAVSVLFLSKSFLFLD